MQVSIIIVNYNTKELTRNCLKSIYEQTSDIDFEVIVSDNGSTDSSIEMIKSEFPQVILIENNTNLGFGSANNRGLEIAKGEFIFYLNSDTILLNNAIKIFYDYWKANDDGTFGVLGCNLLDQDGNITSSWGEFHNSSKIINDLLHANYGLWKIFFLKIFKREIPQQNETKRTYEKYVGEVDFVTGADLFLRNNEYAKFDEHIFLYCEETDMEFQLEKIGKKRLIIDGPQIIHLEGQSSTTNTKFPFEKLSRFSSRWNNISRIYYIRKNDSRLKASIIKFLTITMWLNPMIIKYNFKHLPDLLKA